MAFGISDGRRQGAIQSIREAIAAASEIPLESIGPDDDLIEDLNLDNLEIVSLGLILEEIFAIAIPDGLFESALYRTAGAMAEWAIRQSDQAAWQESQRDRRRA